MPALSAIPRLPTHVPPPPDLGRAAGDMILADYHGPDRHLRTVCACGVIAAFDPDAWLARRLGWRPIQSFSGSLRCPCGRRHARFEVWPGPLAQSGLKRRAASELYD